MAALAASMAFLGSMPGFPDVGANGPVTIVCPQAVPLPRSMPDANISIKAIAERIAYTRIIASFFPLSFSVRTNAYIMAPYYHYNCDYDDFP